MITGSSAFADDDTACDGSTRLAEPIVERIAGAAYGADRIDGVAAVERLAQATDMDVDGALVDIDVAAPYPVEQLLAREHPAGAFHQEFEQPELGRAEIDRAGRAGHALFLAIELEIADVEHHGDPLGAGAAQQRADARQQFRHRERLDDIVVGGGGEPADPLAFL